MFGPECGYRRGKCHRTDAGRLAVRAGPNGLPAWSWRPSLSRGGVLVARVLSLLAAAHGSQQDPRAGAQQRDVAEHLDDQHYTGGLGLGGDVPESHRREDCHGEVQGVGTGQRLVQICEAVLLRLVTVPAAWAG